MAKNLTAIWETWVRSLGWEDPLEEGMSTHSSIAWRIPMDRGAWWATVPEVTKNQTWLSTQINDSLCIILYVTDKEVTPLKLPLGLLHPSHSADLFFFSSNTMYHGILHEIRISYFMVHCIKLSFLRIHLLLRCSVVSNSLRPHALEPARLLCPWDSSTKNPGVGHHFLLQGILETLGLNSNLLCCLHWQVDSLPLAPPEKPLRVHTCGQK